MRILLVNAKRSLVTALAGCDNVEIVVVRQALRHGNAASQDGVRTLRYVGGQRLNLRAAWQMRKIICDVQPDIVHAFYGRALAHVVLAARSMTLPPKIVSFRGITAPLSPLNLGDWLSYRHPSVTAHACESAAVRESLVASGIDCQKCCVTYNTMAAAPSRQPGRQGLAQFDVPESAFVVGTIATMRHVKGIDLLLRAAIECADLSDLYWILFGNVVDRQVRSLASHRRIRDRVRLPGHRPDASELISGADLFVMPSRAEALCQALLEAMHQGVCPVVSDAGGMKEVVRHGQDGVVFPTENVDLLAEAIRELHGDRRLVAQYAAASRQRIAEEFTPQKMAERCLAMYRQLVTEGQSRGAA